MHKHDQYDTHACHVKGRTKGEDTSVVNPGLDEGGIVKVTFEQVSVYDVLDRQEVGGLTP